MPEERLTVVFEASGEVTSARGRVRDGGEEPPGEAEEAES